MTAGTSVQAGPASTPIVDPRYYVEISTLGEQQYTGVSQVAAGLCAAALDDPSPVRFMVGRRLVPDDVVSALLRTRDGSLLDWHLSRTDGALAPLREDFGRAIAIYPNRKFTRRLFDRELQVVHDLRTVLMPHQHKPETVLFHNTAYRTDVATNDLTLCVSEATAADVRSYIVGVDPDRVRTIPLGHAIDTLSRRMLDDESAASQSSERYVMVLGTLEPRKNGRSVLELLARVPTLLAAAKFVFVGHAGWGASMAQTITDLGLDDAVRAGRIVMTGFLSEPAKNLLLHHAAALVYPSLFEGFGLPVLEALCAGVPVVTTRGSSIAEAGGDAPFYFDPFITGDLDRALYAALFDTSAVKIHVDRGRRWAARFDWAGTWSRIKQLVCTITPLENPR